MTDPVAHFEEIAASHDRCFWLDGGGSRPWSGRRSILGWLEGDDVSLTYDAGTGEVTRHRGGRTEVVGDDIFAVLEAESAGDGADVHWVGHFGYASRSDLPAAIDPTDPMPTAVWMRTRNVRIFEHEVNGPADPAEWSRPPGTMVPEVPAAPVPEVVVPAEYRNEFERVQEELRAGNSYEVNLTYRLAVRSGLDPVTAYLRLRELNPAPYAGFLQHHGTWLLSSSPERYATIDRHRMIEAKPIKGTTPRGATPEEDERQRRHLAADPKFRAENLMIVDLLRNDLATVCAPGTVDVPVLMDVESYASVHQLVSTVRGRLRDDLGTIAALRALFPAGSMTGAPKLRTMEIIQDVEATARGVYAGAFGWISGDGRADLGVVIRSMTTAGDQIWRLGTGGGITVRSDVEEEYAESRWKAERLRRVLD
ncbi:aminodeoxychorismate synthase component I [Nocardioides sp. JQ2195]|uniref:aminodeoxychorismate synthase component I n=1 Tax=Nocardioides sp. JQ2195 TaxID=2592334 RepID=UPI00143E6933|nr:aminodeoxychorismate synthase component I [Nocardioides sp. JQ2195]QIX25287.1 aminodeoxychorismate synthase component I [Nocardioides sp. JQ2195]